MQFRDIIGQEEVKQRLIRSHRDGRIAHALMFLGPQGSGNLALAIAFAQFIQCAERTDEDSCGKCPSCRKISSYQHADLHFSFPYFNKKSDGSDTLSSDYAAEWREALLESPYFTVDHWLGRLTKENKQLNFPVAEAGYIISRLSLKSYEGGAKIMIIWLAELIKAETANKLLKIVEEPPENTLFFFVAHRSDTILPTIQSRVQVIQVPRLPDEVVSAGLISQGYDPSAAEAIAHYADGDWWKAQVLAGSEDPNAKLAIRFQTWMRTCYKLDVSAIVRWSDELHELSREEQKQFISYALDQIRQNLMRNYVGARLSRMNEGELAFSDKFAPFINDLNAEDLVEEITEVYHDISRNAYSKLALTDLSFRVHHLLHRKATDPA